MNGGQCYGAELFRNTDTDQATHSKEQYKLELPPLLHEIESAIEKLKARKAPGIDGIPAELIKHSGPAAKVALHRLISKIWKENEWPRDWKTQEFIPIHKSGSRTECSNYRVISLISHASKVLLIILSSRMQTKMEMKMPDEQAGFRTGGGCADMLVELHVHNSL